MEQMRGFEPTSSHLRYLPHIKPNFTMNQFIVLLDLANPRPPYHRCDAPGANVLSPRRCGQLYAAVSKYSYNRTNTTAGTVAPQPL